jgi:NADH:ubiquinone oxidoreductase subunit C
MTQDITNQDNNNFLIINDLFNGVKHTIIASYLNDNSIANFKIITYRQTSWEFILFLKMHSILTINIVIDCVIIDIININYRFSINYILKSYNNNLIIILITKTNSILPLISLQNLYIAFNWAEREIWDLYGIIFINHPDLRRILTDYGFFGHPLRKDFPLVGFHELYYNDINKRLEYEGIELSQQFRSRHLFTIWEY